MTTTITKELLASKAKPRYKEVDVPGWGIVGIRSVDEVTRSRRVSAMYEAQEKGDDVPRYTMRLYKLVDQLMQNETTQLLTLADMPMLLSLDSAKLDPLSDAVDAFNEESEGNG